MRRLLKLVLLLLAVPGAILCIASFLHHGRTVLLHRQQTDGSHDFVVVENRSLVLARQKVLAVGNANFPLADASKFGEMQLFLRTEEKGQYKIAASLSVDAYGSQWRHGFLYITFGPVTLGAGTMNVMCRAVGVPMWAIGAVLALPGVVIALRAARRQRLRSRRRRMGLCLNCGYDLRGSSGRCPECGAASDEKTITEHSTSNIEC